MLDIPLEKFEEARKTIKGKVLETPLIELLSSEIPQDLKIFLKAECLQPTGSFKIRGATNSISLLTPEQKKIGVVTYSTGNHAQGVALAAKRLGIHSVIVMSPDAPDFKIEATRSYGAEVIMTEPNSQVRRKLAEDLAKEKGYSLIPPYDYINTLAGQGTISLEILDQLEPAFIFVPIGGGGLISGIATAAKKRNPKITIIGVESDLENDAYMSFKSGHKVSLEKCSNSIADALRVLTLGDLTYPLIKKYVDDIITVTESQIAKATFLTIKSTRLIVEPAGAVALAGILSYPHKLPSKTPIVSLASGGNTTLAYLNQLQKQF
jgi:threonine dehydratase